MSNRLIIIDEYFKNYNGHYYEYNKSVQDLFIENKWTTQIYANKKIVLEIQDELSAIPFFNGLEQDYFIFKLPIVGPVLRRIFFWRQFYLEILKLIKKENESNVYFFFTTVLWFNILPIALACSTAKFKAVIMFRVPFKNHIGIPKWIHFSFDYLYLFCISKLIKEKTYFFTDSEVISEEAKALYKIEPQVLPIPHLSLVDLPPNYIFNPNAVTLYFPGPIRIEKGVVFLLNALKHLKIVDPDLFANITLKYQVTSNDKLNKYVEQEVLLLDIKVERLGSLTTQEYYKNLSNADIIILPYDIGHGYSARTSGILSETIALEKPFICTKNSWLAIQSEKFNTGLSIEYNNHYQFHSQLKTIISHYEVYQRLAKNAKLQWLKYHSKKNFFSVFINGLFKEKK